jgi:hypothetical protein
MTLISGTYFICNVENGNRAAIADSNDRSEVIASLGTKLNPEAGEEASGTSTHRQADRCRLTL